MSIVRTLLRDGYDGKAGRKVTFLHYARSAEDQIFAEELAEIAAADNDVTVHLRHGDHVFSEFELRRLVPGYRDTDTWACGPAGLMELVAAAYAEGGEHKLRTEFFKAPRPAAGSTEGDVAFTRSGAWPRPPTPARPSWSRPRRSGSSPSSAAGWASASPARPARPRAPSATC